MNARGTRRPHSRKPYSKGRTKGGSRGTGSEAPGCVLILIVGCLVMLSAGLTLLRMAS